ncbi:hypothetical protein GCM10009863_37600 [Streptomyces axinellae]|uniref:Uncharacterized protein n=1 Tax=Streptomyces axinellae TaxID=552788 RepID=A0ABP6CKK2_9ACTN
MSEPSAGGHERDRQGLYQADVLAFGVLLLSLFPEDFDSEEEEPEEALDEEESEEDDEESEPLESPFLADESEEELDEAALLLDEELRLSFR